MALTKTKEKTKNRVVFEKSTRCKLTRTRYIDNGHDCWGNSESTSQEYVMIDGEMVDIYGDRCIIHNDEEVFEVKMIELLPEDIQKYLDISLYNKLEAEEKERRYKDYLKLKKEFDNDNVYIRDQKISKIIDND